MTTQKMTATVTDLMTLVPKTEILDSYVSRDVFDTINDLDFIERVGREMRHNILLYGDSGSAKTTVGRAYAAREGLPFYAVPLNGATDVQTMLGKYVPTEDGHFKWVDGPVTAIVRSGGVLVLDEINMPTPRILAVLHPLLDSRRVLPLLDHEGEVVPAHDDLIIIGTMNPGYEGTVTMNFALKNRFAVQVPWGYERDIELQLVPLVPSIIDVADQLRRAYRAGDISSPTPTNRLMEFEDFALQLGLDFALANFVSSYEEEEQPSVRQQVDLFRDRLATELASAD